MPAEAEPNNSQCPGLQFNVTGPVEIPEDVRATLMEGKEFHNTPLEWKTDAEEAADARGEDDDDGGPVFQVNDDQTLARLVVKDEILYIHVPSITQVAHTSNITFVVLFSKDAKVHFVTLKGCMSMARTVGEFLAELRMAIN